MVILMEYSGIFNAKKSMIIINTIFFVLQSSSKQ